MTQPRVATAEANGVTLAYRHWDSPSRALHPPTVLLHGVLQTGEGMAHLAEALSQKGEVLVPDLRGRGQSEQPAGGYDPRTMADDVAGLLDSLGFSPSVLIGRLHGGLVAYHLAARRPELVCGLVLGDATPEVSQERAARVLARVAALPPQFSSREEAERFYEEGLRLPPARARHDLPSDLERSVDGGYRWRHNLDLVARIEAAAMPRSDWEILASVQCPTLILSGQRGEIRPETADRMVATMPRARAQVVLGSGHDVFLGPGAEQSLAAIQLFLRGLEHRES
jgi:pimeloyl-ACP methyl ester carboxylesterase